MNLIANHGCAASKSPRRAVSYLLVALLLLQQFLFVSPLISPAAPAAVASPVVSPNIAISQIYGGNGNTYASDYVELFNRGAANASLSGLTVQYASATGTGNFAVAATLSGTLAPGQYYLVKLATTTGTALPTADATGSTNISATAGKLIVANSTTALACNGGSTACSSAQLALIVDLVGYGTANYFEGAAAPAPSNTTAIFRAGNGCTDTDQNSTDFSSGTPAPRNTASQKNPCSGGQTNPSGAGSATPSSVLAGNSTLLTVTVTPGANPTSTGLTVTANLSSIGGSATQAFYDDGTNGDATPNDNVFSYQATVDAATSTGNKTLPVTITDTQNRTGTTNISLTVPSPAPTPPTATGTATPATVQPGGSTLLKVTVTPGTNPTSSGIVVTADLTSIGGSAAQQFFDDGTNGDAAAGDNVFSYQAMIASNAAAGAKSLPVSVADAEGRTASASISLTVSLATAPQTLPFAQDWSNTNLIAANDDWSQVPGIIGYRGDGLTATTGTDPQTIVADGSTTPVNVWANQINPNTFTSGGVAEFEIANPTIALQGSGTASAPHVVISINTTGKNNITVSYNLRDIDGSSDNAVQPVALQYRVGNSGSYTNVPAAFVADASTGPDEASQVTPVAVQLPPSVENQPLVQLRIITANAVGNDEWIGIDDINITENGTLPISATGTATPNQLNPGDTTLLKVTVSPGSNPTSTGVAVTGDLSSIGGSVNQQFYDDGTNGDVTAGDNVFSYAAQIPANSSGGGRSIPITVTDAQSRNATVSVSLTITAPQDPNEHLALGNPTNAVTDINQPLNYLLSKPQYAVSYNRDKGTPNWVSWHLDSTWLGSAARQNDFRPDDTLPTDWYHVTQTDYSGSGFDRGHHTPSADRTRSVADNSATFYMTNMMPQAPGNNQGPWAVLEDYARGLIGQGNELYIVAGGTGQGGTGSGGGVTNTLQGGKITVPAYTWKVILVLPNGDNDASRVNTSTRTIAVIMPNNDNIRSNAWQQYIVSVDQVEALTGYDFFSNVPVGIQNVIEARIDGTNCSFSLDSNTANASAGGSTGSVSVTAGGGCGWTATSNANWITINGAATGSGSGSVNYTIAANTGAARTGSLIIGGQTFTVSQAAANYSVSGNVFYGITPAGQQAPIAVSGVALNAVGTGSPSATTDSTGAYTLNNLNAGENYAVTASKTLDVNGITPFDAVLILRHLAAGGTGPNALTENQVQAANTDGSVDENQNPTITPFDATLILRYAAAGGSPTPNTGHTGQWQFAPPSRNYTLTGSLAGENYTAVLIGEVNGSWMPPANPASFAGQEAEQPEQAETALVRAEESSVVIATEKETESKQRFEKGEAATSSLADETPASDAGSAEIRLSLPENAASSRGAVVKIPVSLENKTGREISSFALAVRFDPKVLQPDNAGVETAESLSSHGFTVVSDSSREGRIGIAASAPNNAVKESGTLLYLRFKVVGNARGLNRTAAATTALSFESDQSRRAAFEDKFGNKVSAATANGFFSIATATPGASVSVTGRVLTNDGRGIRNVMVRLVDEQGQERMVLTTSFGYFNFSDVAGGDQQHRYTISVWSKRYSFTQNWQTFSFAGEANDLVFRADQ